MKEIFKHLVIFLLTFEAKLVIRKYKPKIIGITGSVGKTSTKDALYTVLSKKLSVRKSEKSFNTEFGAPLTVLGLPTAWGSGRGWLRNLWLGLRPIFTNSPYPEWLVLEMGADHPGDIEKLTRWLPLDVGIVTGMGDVPVHVEFFPNVDAVVREKSFVPKSVKKEGFVLLNTDAPRVAEMKDVTEAKVFTYGFNEGSNFHGTNFSIEYNDKGQPSGIAFDMEQEKETVRVVIDQTVGAGHAFSAIAALACGKLLGFSVQELADSLRTHSATAGRLHIVPGARGATVIDDTYNSSPVAARLALDTLANIRTSGRKIAVLADMAELGTHSKDQHIQVGMYARDRVDLLITFGPKARGIAEGALSAGLSPEKVKSFEDREALNNFLKSTVTEGDIILVKGSQSMRMEKVVEEIMAEPARKKELLVRQDDEWTRR